MNEDNAFKIELSLRNFENYFCAKYEKKGKEEIEQIRQMLCPPLIRTKNNTLTTESLMKSYSEK